MTPEFDVWMAFILITLSGLALIGVLLLIATMRPRGYRKFRMSRKQKRKLIKQMKGRII